MDAQIAHRLKAEEQAKEQLQFSQIVRKANEPVQAPYKHRQHPALAQVRSNTYSGYNRVERDLETNHIGRQTTTDRYPQEAQHILQRIEQDNSMEYSQTGNSNHNQVSPIK